VVALYAPSSSSASSSVAREIFPLGKVRLSLRSFITALTSLKGTPSGNLY
jgi:hypothetical protein